MKALHWDITRRCNLRCKHCYNADKYFNKESAVYSENELSLEEAKAVVEFAVKNGFHKIHMLGGEPLAYPYIFEIIGLIKKNGLLVTMNSNATLLDDDMQNKLIDLGVDHFAASLDGVTMHTNDFVRGEGCFEIVCRNMKSFNKKINEKKSATQTALAFSLSKSNYRELGGLPQLTADMGCKLLAISLFVECGNGEKNKELFETAIEDQFDALEKMVSEKLWKYDLHLQLDARPLVAEYLRTKYNAKVIFNIYNSLCCAGENIWYLEADGRVHPCLVYRTAAGEVAEKKGIIQPEKIFLPIQNGVESVLQTNYWQVFSQYKNKFDKSRIFTCAGCAFSDMCTPCPFEYGQYDKVVDECEWVLRNLNRDYNVYGKKRIQEVSGLRISSDMVYINGNPVLKINNTSAEMIHILLKQGLLSKAVECIVEEYQVEYKQVFIDMMYLFYNLLSVKGIYLYENS